MSRPSLHTGAQELARVQKQGVDQWLRAGITAARAGQRERARELLARVVEEDEENVLGWLWLSGVVDGLGEKERCLEKVIALDPDNQATHARLAYIQRQRADRGLRAGIVAMQAGQRERARELLRRVEEGALHWGTPLTVAALAYLLGIALAELLTTYAEPRLGLLAHCLLLAGLLFHSSRVSRQEERALLVSLTFAPLIRILSLSLPLTQFPVVYWYLITSVPLFAAALVASRALGYSWRDLGLHLNGWPLQIAIGLSGMVFGAVEYLILRPAPLIPALEWAYVWQPALILLVSTGLLEEMIFRGLLQRAAGDGLGRWGLVYVAVLFAVLHVGYHSLVDVLFVLGVGLFFGWAAQRTRSLVGVTISHGWTNIMLFLVMPFLQG